MAENMAESVKAQATQAVEKLKLLVGFAPSEPEPQEQSILDEMTQYCKMTRMQRLYGFGVCFGLGLLCSLLSMLVFFHPIKFAVTYTLGNLLSLGSTGFLLGPWRQVKMMFDPIRIISTIVYLVSLVLALVCAIVLHDALLTILCIIVEFCALTWYSLSYIPFAQGLAKKILMSCVEVEV